MHVRRFALVLVLAVLITAGCGPAGVENRRLLNGVAWARTSLERGMVCEQAYSLASVRLDQALADPDWTAMLHQEDGYQQLPPAVIVDVDETVLSNLPSFARQVREGRAFSSEEWREWVEEASAEPLPGAKEFIDTAREKGVAVFFVTNRKAGGHEATVRNLREKIGDWVEPDHVLCRDDGRDKSARRDKVAGRHRVLLLIGDDYNDFVMLESDDWRERNRLGRQYADLWGVKWIVLPNTIYGSWERVLFGNRSGLSEQEKIRHMTGALAP